MNGLTSVWSPADTAALLIDLAGEYPAEVGSSVVLADLVDREL